MQIAKVQTCLGVSRPDHAAVATHPQAQLGGGTRFPRALVRNDVALWRNVERLYLVPGLCLGTALRLAPPFGRNWVSGPVGAKNASKEAGRACWTVHSQAEPGNERKSRVGLAPPVRHSRVRGNPRSSPALNCEEPFFWLTPLHSCDHNHVTRHLAKWRLLRRIVLLTA